MENKNDITNDAMISNFIENHMLLITGVISALLMYFLTSVSDTLLMFIAVVLAILFGAIGIKTILNNKKETKEEVNN